MFKKYKIIVEKQRELTETSLIHDEVTASKPEESKDIAYYRNEPETPTTRDECCKEFIAVITRCYKHLLAVDGSYTGRTLESVLSIKPCFFNFPQRRTELVQAICDSKVLEQFYNVLTRTTIVDVCSYTMKFRVSYVILNNLMNFTDVSKSFAQAACDTAKVITLSVSHSKTLYFTANRIIKGKNFKMIDMGFIEHFAKVLRYQFSDIELSNKNIEQWIQRAVGLIYNCIRHISRHAVYEKENVREIMRSFANSENETTKAVAVMAVSYLISEVENSQLEDTGAIPYMVKCMTKSLARDTGRYEGFMTLELAEALVKMAVNDANKIKLVDAGVLPDLVTMMKGNDMDDAFIAIKLIWILSFDDNVKQRIITEPGCVEVLKILEQSKNKEIAKEAKGALWKISEETKHKKERENNALAQTPEFGNHIFISYSHGNKTTVHNLSKRLQADGHKVWIDVEQMGGSTLESMASAVENAKVVLVCASENYKLSPSCRTEAEYVFQLKRPIVPLMMERYYKPDGWLGFLMGAKMYVNFDGKFEFEYAYQMLLKELKPLLLNMMESVVDGPEPILPQRIPGLGALPPIPPGPKRQEPLVASWDNDKVREWMAVNQIDKLGPKILQFLETMDGNMLIEFCKLKKMAPDFFLNQMMNQYNLDLKSILQLISCIDRLDC